MDFVQFSKDYQRMCSSYHHVCDVCPLGMRFDICECNCGDFILNNPEEVEEIVGFWAEAHPIRTRAEKFFKEVPDFARSDDGYPKIAPCLLDRALGERCHYSLGLKTHACPNMTCDVCRKQYWGEECNY